jgi:hypothetical protein
MVLKAAVGVLATLAFSGGVAFASMGPAMSSSPLHVQLKAQNGSGENGTATLTQMKKGVQVVVTIPNAPAAAQPTHIHPGTCAHLNPVPKYPLNNLVHGKSTTLVPGVKLSDLTGGKFAINVHKSTNDLKDYVSCGEIK